MSNKALILDGRVGDDPIADRSLDLVAGWLAERHWDAMPQTLRDVDIAPCLGCFGCWVKTPGECVIDDAGRDVARRFVQSDLVIYLSPIQFGGYSHELKKAVDRLIPNISPMFQLIRGEVHHRKRYRRYPRLLALGWLTRRTADQEDTFRAMVQRNGINMHAPKVLAEVFEADEPNEAMARRVAWALSEVTGS
jgi:hypothetical protein